MDDEKIDDIIKDSRDDIKTEETQKKLKRYDKKDSLLGGKKWKKRRDPGEGIKIREDADETLLSCGHPYSIGIGHEASCGHLICRDCLETCDLVCAEPGCFRKFCSVDKCKNKPHMYAGLPFCLKHKLLLMNELACIGLFSGKKAQQILENYKREYEMKKSKTRSRIQKEPRDKSDERKDVSRRPDRA